MGGIFVKKSDSEPRPANCTLLSWTTGLVGIDWIEELVKTEYEKDLGGDGYPCRYAIRGKDFFPRISAALQSGGRSITVLGDDFSHAFGTTHGVKVDMVAIEGCRPDVTLIVEAWDLS